MKDCRASSTMVRGVVRVRVHSTLPSTRLDHFETQPQPQPYIKRTRGPKLIMSLRILPLLRNTQFPALQEQPKDFNPAAQIGLSKTTIPSSASNHIWPWHGNHGRFKYPQTRVFNQGSRYKSRHIFPAYGHGRAKDQQCVPPCQPSLATTLGCHHANICYSPAQMKSVFTAWRQQPKSTPFRSAVRVPLSSLT